MGYFLWMEEVGRFGYGCWSMTVTISVVAVLTDCDMIEVRIHSSVKLHRAK